MAPKTILILGAGPRIGYSVADKFKAEGYQVAVASPNLKGVETAFAHVKEKLGVPNVVVFNAAAFSRPPSIDDPFDLAPEAFARDTNLNASGAFAALHEAVKGFKTLGSDIPKAFIATGNVLPFHPSAFGVSLGAGKAALVHLINIGSTAYRSPNFRFYFASQVTDKGTTVGQPELSGQAHSELYWILANEKEQGSWDVRFLSDGRVVSSKTE